MTAPIFAPPKPSGISFSTTVKVYGRDGQPYGVNAHLEGPFCVHESLLTMSQAMLRTGDRLFAVAHVESGRSLVNLLKLADAVELLNQMRLAQVLQPGRDWRGWAAQGEPAAVGADAGVQEAEG